MPPVYRARREYKEFSKNKILTQASVEVRSIPNTYSAVKIDFTRSAEQMLETSAMA